MESRGGHGCFPHLLPTPAALQIMRRTPQTWSLRIPLPKSSPKTSPWKFPSTPPLWCLLDLEPGGEYFMAATGAVRNVFVYGTLLAPEVLTALLHRVPRASLAVVHDYHRYSITDRIYPATLPKKGDQVFGKVLFDLSDQELHILDEFEDVEYIKSIVSSLTLKAHAIDSEEPVKSTATDEAQEMIESGCLERVSNALTIPNGLTVPNGHTDDVAPEEKTVEISPGRIVGLSLATEVTASMYVWATEGDPKLVGNWDFEEWAKTYLEDYVKMCEEFESELSKRFEDSGE